MLSLLGPCVSNVSSSISTQKVLVVNLRNVENLTLPLEKLHRSLIKDEQCKDEKGVSRRHWRSHFHAPFSFRFRAKRDMTASSYLPWGYAAILKWFKNAVTGQSWPCLQQWTKVHLCPLPDLVNCQNSHRGSNHSGIWKSIGNGKQVHLSQPLWAQSRLTIMAFFKSL